VLLKLICEPEVTMVTVQETLPVAEQLFPGRPAPDGTEDARWQAIIQVAMFAEREPEVIWPFVLKWGSHEEEDVRAAIATCLLEDLLQYHFDVLFPLVASAAKSNEFFAKTTAMCWKFGEAAEPTRAVTRRTLFPQENSRSALPRAEALSLVWIHSLWLISRS
jgi:hypothetical protein